MAVPPQLNEIWAIWREISGHANHLVPLNLYAAPGALRDGIRTIFLDGSNHWEMLRVLDIGELPVPEASVHLVVIESESGPSGSELAFIRRLPPNEILLLLPDIPPAALGARRREVAAIVGTRLERVVATSTSSELRDALIARLLQIFELHAVALARQFPALRAEATQQEIARTSQQNAMVGLIPVPGADMPVMTINQIKMVMRLAAMHDQPMTHERLKEVLAVLGGGYALRTAARQLAKFIPGPGWLISGGMGYAGTLAMGRAALEYFKRSSAGHSGITTLGDDGRPIIDTKATVIKTE
ncbi:MAG: DUF697 domain-containing protein [Candidatus Sericytochromatia bacterium]|nr:DUF697 domain-containing protein [Candidatus Sericytochromatia bacterium]